jgi:hypothetical protein
MSDMKIEGWLTAHLPSGALELRNSDNSLMVFVCPSLPDMICRNLLSSLLACFDGKQVLPVRRLSDDFEDNEDNEDDEETLDKVVDKVIARPFHCLHFSIWNRYATKVSFHVPL